MIRGVLACLGRRHESSPSALGSSRPNVGHKTVVIIDDHLETLRTVCQALDGESWHLETAATGESGIRKVLGCGADLILVDPDILAADGTRLTRRLLADEDLIPIPIVALTEAWPHGEAAARGPFDGTIARPIDIPALPGRIRSFLEPPRQTHASDFAVILRRLAEMGGRRQQMIGLLDAIDAALPQSQFSEGTRTGLQRLAEILEGHQSQSLVEYLQRAERLSCVATTRARNRFRSVIRLSRESLQADADAIPGMAELRAGYLDHRRAELSSLNHSLRIGDFAALHKAGHNLKGTGAAYGFSELTDIGRALELAAKDGDEAGVEILMDQAEAYMAIVRP